MTFMGHASLETEGGVVWRTSWRRIFRTPDRWTCRWNERVMTSGCRPEPSSRENQVAVDPRAAEGQALLELTGPVRSELGRGADVEGDRP
jgi:hypothetical protein